MGTEHQRDLLQRKGVCSHLRQKLLITDMPRASPSRIVVRDTDRRADVVIDLWANGLINISPHFLFRCLPHVSVKP